MRAVWASEIEPLPILITSRRLPQVEHLGDITRIDGREVEPVDVITFGSPCQDLSLAGTWQGLAGARSGLFFHAIRVINEIREATDGRYPRWRSGRTSPEPPTPTKAMISRPSWPRSSASASRAPPVCLRLQAAGAGLGPLWVEDSALRGEYSTRNSSACPNDARESCLSQILQAHVPARFFLSPRACQGILRRAHQQGKTMPPLLQAALEEVASAAGRSRSRSP